MVTVAVALDVVVTVCVEVEVEIDGEVNVDVTVEVDPTVTVEVEVEVSVVVRVVVTVELAGPTKLSDSIRGASGTWLKLNEFIMSCAATTLGAVGCNPNKVSASFIMEANS